MLSQVTESALAAIEVALIIKTKVYRSLNMGVLQGGRATPVEFGRDLNPPWVAKTAKSLQFISFFAMGHPLGNRKPLKTIEFIDVFELGRHKEASRDPWGHL